MANEYIFMIPIGIILIGISLFLGYIIAKRKLKRKAKKISQKEMQELVKEQEANNKRSEERGLRIIAMKNRGEEKVVKEIKKSSKLKKK